MNQAQTGSIRRALNLVRDFFTTRARNEGLPWFSARVALPIVGYWRAGYLIRGQDPVESPVVAGPTGPGLMDEIYDAERERRQGLEGKLAGLLAVATFLLPVAVAQAGVALSQCDRLTTGAAALASLHLITLLALGLMGLRTRQVEMLGLDSLPRIAPLKPVSGRAAIAREKASAVANNLPITWQLANGISAAQASIAWAAVLIAFAAFRLLGQ